MSRIDEILDFWFLPPADPEHGTQRACWFRKDSAFDATIGERFGADVTRALAGELEAWLASADGTLAYVLLLDQFTRNLHRDDALAFAGDPRARAATRGAIARRFDRALPPFKRMFLYMPLMHSEALVDQDDSVALFERIAEEDPRIDESTWAVRHRAIIARFGRFPHRNAALGRESTAAEAKFLEEPGSSF